MEITAKEIERQAGRIDEQVERYYQALNRVILDLRDASNIVPPGDSDLGKKMRQCSDTFMNLQGVTKVKFQQLSSIMHKYASETIANEEQTSTDVSAFDNTLEEVNNSISNINTGD